MVAYALMNPKVAPMTKRTFGGSYALQSLKARRLLYIGRGFSTARLTESQPRAINPTAHAVQANPICRTSCPAAGVETNPPGYGISPILSKNLRDDSELY
jgi:hypothetical protein